jgi:hypothetical protein
MPVILATLKAEIRRIMVQGHPGQIVLETPLPPICKVTRSKWTGVVAQALDSLICKHETLSSNCSSTKKKKKKDFFVDFLLWRTKAVACEHFLLLLLDSSPLPTGSFC